MQIWEPIWQKFNALLGQHFPGDGLWRLIAALAVVCVGCGVLEVLFQFVRRRLTAAFEKRGYSVDSGVMTAFLPALRLAGAALLLWLIEPVIKFAAKFAAILHATEVLLLAAASVVMVYGLIAWLERLRIALPVHLQDQFPARALGRLQRFLRVTTLVAALVFSIYNLRSFYPGWLLRYPAWSYLMPAAVIVMILTAIRQVDGFITGMALVLKSSEENVRLRLSLEAARWPIRLLLFALAVYSARAFLALPSPADRIADTSIDLLGTLAVVAFAYRLIELMVFELTKFAEREDNLLDRSFVQMMRMIARITVIVFGGIYVLRAVSGKPLSALLAGLGIGGLALALAAQDTLKNFFGSIMIMLDKPFTVGQRVVASGIDGTVEDIGFRSTRVRTLTGNLVTIPNEKMAGDSVENIGRRPSIRRLTNITITYDTPPPKVEKAVAIIRELLDNHEGMNPEFPPRVYFSEFNDTSLNILMVYWYFPPDYWAYLDFSERVNLEIMRRFEAEGIEFAFPTTTTYLAHDPRRPLKIDVSQHDPPDGKTK